MATAIKPKKRCCKDRPRCKRCLVVLERLRDQGLARRKPNGRYKLDANLRKKRLKAARAR